MLGQPAASHIASVSAASVLFRLTQGDEGFATHPVIFVMTDPKWQMERVGLEAGPLWQWLYQALAKAGLPMIFIETRHAKAT